MTLHYGPGILYTGDPATGQWEPIGWVVCAHCHGTGYDAMGCHRCPFGCLELQHMSQGLSAPGVATGGGTHAG